MYIYIYSSFIPVQTDPYWSYRLQLLSFLKQNTDGPCEQLTTSCSALRSPLMVDGLVKYLQSINQSILQVFHKVRL